MTILPRIVLAMAVVACWSARLSSLPQVVKSDGPKPQFEVATVRPNKSGESGASLGPRPGGRLDRHQPDGSQSDPQCLQRPAVSTHRRTGLDGLDRFDIQAKAADADVDAKGMLPYPQFMLRLQSLLEDRFKMVTHWETRELPVYGLVLATPGKLGPKLKLHNGDCDRPPGSAPPAPGSATVNCGTRANTARRQGDGPGIRMETFARNLSGGSGRYIIDKTGLDWGSYDLELEFTPDQSPDTTGPSLFTAMQEQLGLKLDSQRAPVEVVVIDRVERPTPD